MKDLSDKEILARYNRGEPEAFIALRDRFFPYLFTWLNRALGDPLTAEDILSGMFLRFYETRKPFQNLSSLKSYLFVAARNAKAEYFRVKLQREQSEMEFNRSATGETEDEKEKAAEIRAVIRQRLEQHLKALPKKCRKVFELSLMEKLTDREISEKLGISEKTVQNQLKLAQNRLKVLVAKTNMVTVPVFFAAAFYSSLAHHFWRLLSM
jgi:RNA polymerase sigma-19 factor, ECF subfamily